MRANHRFISLNGTWKLQGRKELPGKDISANWEYAEFSTSATVPGNLELELEKAGVVPELFVGRNAEQLRPYEFFEWLYEYEFEYDDSLRNLRLILEGVDCLGTVFLNGQKLGETSNAFIPHEFPVRDQLKRGSNRLTVHLASANNRLAEYPLLPGTASMTPYNMEALWIRKPAHAWGWDIAPRMALGGLFRGVRLEETPEHRLEELFLDTVKATPELAILRLHLKAVTPALPDAGKLLVKVTAVCGTDHREKTFSLWSYQGDFAWEIPSPQLWWPRNYGQPNLYAVTVVLLTPAGKTLAEEHLTLGIRRIELKRAEYATDSAEPDFQFIVNGLPVRIFGMNHVPADALHSRDTGRYDMILDNAAELNCNMIRVWGGGVYESEEFYDRCDQEGILVWQDFMMGCALYPDTPEFHAVMWHETETVIRQLRQHPSIALWAGDNECDLVNDWFQYRLNPNGNRITRELLPAVCRMHDPLRPYLPSSPFISEEANRQGRAAGENNMFFAPEQHLWGPRDYFKSDFYAKSKTSFTSETGYHGCPCVSSIRKFIPEESLWPMTDNSMWNYHASAPYLADDDIFAYRVPLMAKQIREYFGQDALSLEDFACASQIVQAEGIKYLIELNKQHSKRSGILWWNLIDCWPQFSDSVMDYYGGRKLAWHYIKVVQQGLLGMVSEANAWRRKVVFSNDTGRAAEGTFELFDILSEQILHSGNFSVAAGGLSTALEFEVFTTQKQLLGLRWQQSDGRTGVNHFLTGYPTFDFVFYRSKILPALAVLYGTFTADEVGK